MTQIINLSSQVEEYLPRQLLKFIKDAGEKANRLGQRVYLVGGTVRDLFLGRPSLDLDLVIEGDALKLARELAENSQAKLIVHSRFGTAKLSYSNFNLDLATARRETYSRPGALPTVSAGTLTDDLFRRDFSINAMALCLTPQHYGELIDPYQGKEDLDYRLIRVLHQKSFIDDATRILRALRYEQRLGFRLEPETARLLRRDLSMLDTISSDRIRHELELILKEDRPEQILHRAEEIGVLHQLHPSLRGNGWLAEKFDQARQLTKQTPPLSVYLSLLVYRLTEEESEHFLSRFNLTKRLTQALRHTHYLKAQLSSLAEPHLKSSDVFKLLHQFTLPAIQANALAIDSSIIRQRLQLFLTKLRYVKPSLTGEDLKRLGIPPGPKLGEILEALHEAKLNGKVKTRQEEEKLVRDWYTR